MSLVMLAASAMTQSAVCRCIIIERGESLDKWAQRIEPDFVTILQARFYCLLPGGFVLLTSTASPFMLQALSVSIVMRDARLECARCWVGSSHGTV